MLRNYQNLVQRSVEMSHPLVPVPHFSQDRRPSSSVPSRCTPHVLRRTTTSSSAPSRSGMMRPDGPVFNQLAQITDYLFLSGARAVHYSRIVERGITCVINVTIELPNLPIPNVEYVKVPVDDTPYANLFNYFDVVADKIAEVRRQGGRTLVHCIAGVSRSATLCIAYLMKYEGMSLRKAYLHVKARRPIAHPNHGFFKQLIDYERRLFGQETVRMVTSTAGLIPDVYEEEYRNIVWLSTYKSDFGNCVST
uniref:protein-serine/threonine phosphatase n=1 Tax=Hemiscolopendra marginata TaxID=943146 RepID=A0A646QF89_9MYRI